MIEQRIIPQSTTHLDAAHVRQSRIEEQGIERCAPRELQRTTSALDANHTIVIQLENALDRTAFPLAATGDEYKTGPLR